LGIEDPHSEDRTFFLREGFEVFEKHAADTVNGVGMPTKGNVPNNPSPEAPRLISLAPVSE